MLCLFYIVFAMHFVMSIIKRKIMPSVAEATRLQQ